jgi:hypothetical protein
MEGNIDSGGRNGGYSERLQILWVVWRKRVLKAVGMCSRKARSSQPIEMRKETRIKKLSEVKIEFSYLDTQATVAGSKEICKKKRNHESRRQNRWRKARNVKRQSSWSEAAKKWDFVFFYAQPFLKPSHVQSPQNNKTKIAATAYPQEASSSACWSCAGVLTSTGSA